MSQSAIERIQNNRGGVNLSPLERKEIDALIRSKDHHHQEAVDGWTEALAEIARLEKKLENATAPRKREYLNIIPMRLSVGDTPAELRPMSSRFAEAARADRSPFQVDVEADTVPYVAIDGPIAPSEAAGLIDTVLSKS